jgi:hypothetical protein
MIWKFYFWLFSIVIAASWIQLGFVKLTAHDIIDIPVTVLGLVGLFGFAYRRRIGFAVIWRVLSVAVLAWDIYYNLQAGRTLTPFASVLLITAPCYVALVLYGYRSRSLWSKEEH